MWVSVCGLCDSVMVCDDSSTCTGSIYICCDVELYGE